MTANRIQSGPSARVHVAYSCRKSGTLHTHKPTHPHGGFEQPHLGVYIMPDMGPTILYQIHFSSVLHLTDMANKYN